MEKGRAAQPTLIIRLVYNTMLRALIRATTPPHNHVSTVNDVDVLNSLYRDPFLFLGKPNLEAVLVWLLQKYRYAAEVSVRTNTKLTWESSSERRVADHFHHDHRFFGKGFHERDGMAEALKKNFPDNGSKIVGCLVVVPNWVLELVFWQWWPNVWTVEASMFDYWIFAANIESLVIL